MDDSSASWNKVGLGYAFLAYAAWGFLPLYWKMLERVPAHELLLHRIFWSFIFVFAVLILVGKWNSIRGFFKSKRTMLSVTLSASLISLNWFIYIWAVNSGQIVEASLGYYINPLISVLMGLIILKERLKGMQYAALFLAAIGVSIPIIHYGSVPWIALVLALSFALYGLAKKMTKLDSLTGLALETMIVTPFALMYLMYLEVEGSGSIRLLNTTEILFLLGSGIATATPLFWFAQAANRIPLSAVGFMQYLAPTISLLIGVMIYNEPFTIVELTCFVFIWTASILYALSQTKLFSAKKKMVRLADPPVTAEHKSP